MKLLIVNLFRKLCLLIFVGFLLTSLTIQNFVTYTHAKPLTQSNDPTTGWHTFLGAGASSFPSAIDIAVDNSGNVYVTGHSREWGTPIRAYSDGLDVYVAKLDNHGTLIWMTFLGGDLDDYGGSIISDAYDNVYVVGSSNGSWGSPINAHNGLREVFVAKLNSNGTLQWNTFMGGLNQNDNGWGVIVDDVGSIYVTGNSNISWGDPVNEFKGDFDAFVAKLTNNGEPQWNTFVGSVDRDSGTNITIDSSHNVYIVGESNSTWGDPVNAHTGGDFDAFVAKLNTNGVIQWNTFMGSMEEDGGSDLSLDNNGNIYIIGTSYAAWGNPLKNFSGDNDPFVAKLDGTGNLQWNTFLGSTYSNLFSTFVEDGKGITVGSDGNVYVTGASMGTWGSPSEPFHGDQDAFVATLNQNGAVIWNTFIGTSEENDDANSIAIDRMGNFYSFGSAGDTWGDPVNDFVGIRDCFIVQFKSPEQKVFLPLIMR